eukprot:jgi/Chrpa1/3087/Chrysochromulina_OHIO_Genome00011810-RA
MSRPAQMSKQAKEVSLGPGAATPAVAESFTVSAAPDRGPAHARTLCVAYEKENAQGKSRSDR